MRPDEVEEPSLALRRSAVGNEETEGNLAHGEEMQDDQGREQPDPDELRRRAAEASADAAGARPTMMGGVGHASAETRHQRVQWTDAKNNRAAAAMTPTAMNRQRDVSESLAQLCSCVPLLP